MSLPSSFQLEIPPSIASFSGTPGTQVAECCHFLYAYLLHQLTAAKEAKEGSTGDRPEKACSASLHKLVQKPHTFRDYLHYRRRPILVGITTYESYQEGLKSGLIPYPDTEKEQIAGNCALMVVGYRQEESELLFLCNLCMKSSVEDDDQDKIGLSDHPGHVWISSHYLMNKDLCRECWITGSI